VIASGQGYPWAIAVDNSGVYWTNVNDNTLVMCPQSGCGSNSPAVIATGGITSVALDSTAIYWVDNTNIRKVAK
jgi:hypothetical protein